MNLLYTLALAAQATAPSGGAAPRGMDPTTQMILMAGVIFMMFYFIILRPQRREQRRQEDMRNSVKKGDKVVTIGGIHGTVTAVDTTNNTVSVQVDRNVKIDFSKAAISTVVRRDDAREVEEPKKAEK
jgi:preprotein translocase subunit YajC